MRDRNGVGHRAVSRFHGMSGMATASPEGHGFLQAAMVPWGLLPLGLVTQYVVIRSPLDREYITTQLVVVSHHRTCISACVHLRFNQVDSKLIQVVFQSFE